MKRTFSLAGVALLGFALLGTGCPAPVANDGGNDAGNDTVSGPDITTACTSYCQTFSSQCSTTVASCQTSCLCRASAHPSCTGAIATYVDCASRTALLSCTSGDSLSTLCDTERAARDSCLSTAAGADAGPMCAADAGDAGSPVDQQCQAFCDHAATAGCSGFTPTNCLTGCHTIATRGASCPTELNALLACFSTATSFMCSASTGAALPNGCDSEMNALVACW